MVYEDSAELQVVLTQYIEQVVGGAPMFRHAGQDVTARVPLFLRKAYELLEARLFNHSILFALPQKSGSPRSPSELAGHVSHLASTTGHPTAVVLRSVTSYARNRLVQRRVPFVVPGRQLFLPMLMVDLRERFAPMAPADQDQLTAPGQLVILSHLHGKNIEDSSLADLAQSLGYSAMMLSKVAQELVAQRLCELLQQGRTRRLRPTLHGVELWQRAQPLLRSPTKVSHWVQWPKPPADAYIAGTTALSARTMLADSELPTYAMSTRDYRRARDGHELSECADPADAAALVECWRYPPAVLAPGDTVDRLSLYLSLRDSADERVQQALDTMMEAFRW